MHAVVKPSLLVVEYIDTLIGTCRNGDAGYCRCAGQAELLALQWLLTQHAQHYHKATAELQALRQEYAGPEAQPLGDPGDARPEWLPDKVALAGVSDLALLAVCDRGEEAVLRRYRKVLDEDMPIVLRAVAQRHSDAARDHRAQLRSTRAILNATTQAA